MKRVAQTAERVRETTDERGWGFRTLLRETLVLNFFTTSSIMNAVLRIVLKSLPVNMAFSGSCEKIDIVIFLHSNGYVSSSSLESDCAIDSFFCGSEPKLDPTLSSFPFFFNNSAGKM
jgi:hypothetical protein